MSGHTSEPWEYRPAPHDDWGIVRAPHAGLDAGLGGVICQARDPEALSEGVLAPYRDSGKDPWEANARRIVDCVNACEGIADPSVVPDLLAALEGLCERVSAEKIEQASALIARAKGDA